MYETDWLLSKIYNTNENKFVKSFLPCEQSALKRQYSTIFSFNYIKSNHKILEICKLQRIPYFTCIEFKDDVECVEKHVCDIFPVHIGLELDRKIYSFLYGKDELNLPEVQKTMHDLFGTIYVVSPQYFSNIFTNRKEIIHCSKEPDKLYNLYMYDIHDRGYRIWLSNDVNKTCIFRNRNGIEHVIENTQSFQKFISEIEYEVDVKKHINFLKMQQAFVRYKNKHDIDDLSNKNILCCINLLQRGIKYATRNPAEVMKIFRFGSLDKFASKNILYHTKEPKTNKNSNAVIVSSMASTIPATMATTTIPLLSSSMKNMVETKKKNLKRQRNSGNNTSSLQEELQKNQLINLMNTNSAGPVLNYDYENLTQNYKILSPTNLIHSKDSYDRHIKRPVPKNVHTIPTGTNFFICLADTQINVNSPHKWLRLLPKVILTNQPIIKYGPGINTLNELLDIFLENKLIQFDDDNNNNRISKDVTATDNDDVMILINGGIPTNYILRNGVDKIDFFFTCKKLCPFIECIIEENYIVLSLTYGVPMRPISVDILREFWEKSDQFSENSLLGCEKVFYISPLDLKNEFLLDLRKFLYNDLLGGGCPDIVKKYLKYSIPAKIHSVYTFNNRFISDSTAMSYYDLTCENSFVFINRVYKKDDLSNQEIELFDKKTSLINLKTIYSSDPHLTCDGYILSDKVKMNTIMKQKCRFEFELNTKTDVLIWSTEFPKFNNSQNGEIKIYDSYNNCIRKYFLIFKLVRYSKNCLRYKLFNQAKISLFCYPFNDGWIYYLYKYYDEESFILENSKYEMSIIYTTSVDRKIIKNTSIMICTSCIQSERFTGQKIYDICGQKGLCIQQSTERFKKYYNLPSEPDLVISLFSAIGRTPLMTLKAMSENLSVEERKLKENILFGNCEYVLLKNISSLFCSYGNMRVDISLVKVFLANGLNRTIFLLQQDKKSNGCVLPKSFCESLGIYGLIKVNFIMCDEFGEEYNVFINNFRENIY